MLMIYVFYYHEPPVVVHNKEWKSIKHPNRMHIKKPYIFLYNTLVQQKLLKA